MNHKRGWRDLQDKPQTAAQRLGDMALVHPQSKFRWNHDPIHRKHGFALLPEINERYRQQKLYGSKVTQLRRQR